MIDWFGVLSAALWVGGLGILLATIGWARVINKPIRQTLNESAYRRALSLGFVFFAIGMALSVNAWYERVGWIIVAGLTIWDTIQQWRERV